MHSTPNLTAVALARLSRADAGSVQRYLALANHEPTSPPQKRRRQAARAMGSTSSSHGLSLATIGLHRLSRANQECVETYLALVDHKPTSPPPRRLPIRAKVNAPAGPATPTPRRRSAIEFLLLCFFKNNEPPIKVRVPMENISPNFVALGGLDLRLKDGAILQVFINPLTLGEITIFCIMSMSAPPHAEWLMEAVPMPEYMRENCPDHFKHRISFLLGQQSRLSERIAVYQSYCDGRRCKDKVSDIWPEAARTELHYLLNTYLALTKRMKAEKGRQGYTALKQEMKALDARRDAFSGNTWDTCKRSAAQNAADDVEEPSRKKQKPAATSSVPSVQNKNKGKAKDVDASKDMIKYDEFNPGSYILDPSENMTMTVAIYDVPNSVALEKTLELRHGGGLNLASFDFAAKVRGIDTAAGLAIDYDWFCVFARDFVPGAFLTTINMLPRGRFLVCCAATILETECPGLQDWINKSYESLVELAKVYGSHEEGEDEDIVSWDILPSSPPPTSSVAQSSSVVGPSGSSQSSLSLVAGPSRSTSSRRHEVEGDRFLGMRHEREIWDRHDEEDRKLGVIPKRTKEVTKNPSSSEVIVID
ncbi:hypothetical protein B0H19DRAFT_1271699 [Mycena capillaripes]|nr:hypothetical protein B0H19DRAFT_1271699 [Mycena capillaripes]